MKTFTDTQGRVWNLAMDVSALRRVKDLAKVDLMDLANGKLVVELTNDPLMLCDVLYAMVQPEAAAKGIDLAGFCSGMGGDAFDPATEALLAELVDFFPNRRRPLMSAILKKERTLEEMAMTTATARLESGQAEKAMQKALDDATRELDRLAGD